MYEGNRTFLKETESINPIYYNYTLVDFKMIVKLKNSKYIHYSLLTYWDIMYNKEIGGVRIDGRV